jgi:hypothetical protein
MNDPRESKTWQPPLISDNLPSVEEHLKVMEEAGRVLKDTCKVLCVTRDDPQAVRNLPDDIFRRGFAHSRMWAQYAGNHDGVCLVFNKKQLNHRIAGELGQKAIIYHGPVVYRDERYAEDVRAFSLLYDEIISLGMNQYLNKHVAEHHPALFFRKGKNWESEWEYRWVLRGSDALDEFVSIEDSLCGICLGADFPSVYEPLVISACMEYKVRVYRVVWNNGFPMFLPLDGKDHSFDYGEPNNGMHPTPRHGASYEH